jgi:hypothetical protein
MSSTIALAKTLLEKSGRKAIMIRANAGGKVGIGNRFWKKDYALYFVASFAFKWLKSS